jgi:hypothetical protein
MVAAMVESFDFEILYRQARKSEGRLGHNWLIVVHRKSSSTVGYGGNIDLDKRYKLTLRGGKFELAGSQAQLGLCRARIERTMSR